MYTHVHVHHHHVSETYISWIIENSHNICTFFSVFLLYMYMGTHIIYKSCSNYILLGQGLLLVGFLVHPYNRRQKDVFLKIERLFC